MDRNVDRWWALLIVLALATSTTRGASFYVAAGGRPENDGSLAKPWPSVEYALAQVGGGHTIVLQPGEYRGPVTVTAKDAGTEKSPTIIKSEKKWQAVIAAGRLNSHGMGNNQDCPWVVFDGFEVFGAADGISLNGDHSVARNCWVHNNWAMGISSHGTKGAVIENCLIEYNGQHPHLHHGVYADSDGLVMRSNIVRNNSGYGLHLYPSVKNAVISNNLIHGHQTEAGIVVSCPPGGGHNLIVNNTVVNNKVGILLYSNCNGEKVYNNIVVANKRSFDVSESAVNTLADYNLCLPTSSLQGPHGLSADAGFVNPVTHCYWLRADSAARGKATAEFAPKTDFWGRALPADKAPDLGAFSYSKYWASDEAVPEKNAGFGWPYRFTTRADNEIVDLWFLPVWPIQAETYTENFDQEPANWEGINNRSTHFAPKTVTQNFGYSASTHHAGGQPGEIGGKINPAGEVAYYGYRLPDPLTLDAPGIASGKILVERGPGHFLLGFFNADTLNEWRTPNTLVARINGRGDGFHCHVEYCTSRWRCEAGVIGAIVRGQRIEAAEIPGGQVYEWQIAYDPKGAEGSGLLTFALAGKTATCPILKEHHADGATFTHFGLLPIPKTWDNPGEVWIDEVTINGRRFDFSEDPKWNERGNRRTYETNDTRPRFDFSWSRTHWAGGKAAGELGGLIFRGDCRYPSHLAAYGARLSTLTLDTPLYARGKVSMIRGVTDSTASIGFYHSTWSLHSNLAQDQSIPMDYIGINIEGPSSEGFFFYPVYRVHGDVAKALGSNSGKAPRIYPDRKVHNWMLRYDPAGAGGRGRITVSLDEQTCTLDLEPGAKAIGASFNRFGICTPWIDGNSVTVFFDDIEYTCAGETALKDSCKAEM